MGDFSQISVLPKDSFEMIDFTDLNVVKEDVCFIPKFVIGDTYRLDSMSCDGFEMKTDFYKLVGIVKKYEDTPINSVVVTKINKNSNDRIFSLSKNDCKCLNIEYENGLQLFPMSMNWVRHKETVEFDPNDLSTVPLSDIDHTIRKVLIKIKGFSMYDNTYALTPNNDLIEANKLNNAFHAENNLPLSYSDRRALNNAKLFTTVVYPKGVRYKYNNCISEDNSIYVLVSLMVNGESYEFKYDGKSGVPKKYLEGISPQEMFSIYLHNNNPLTIEDYEKKKEDDRIRKEKERKEAEEKKKKAEALERKRLKEKKEKRNKVFDALKNNMDIFPLNEQEKIHKTINLSACRNEEDIDKEIELYISSFDSIFDSASRKIDEIVNVIDDLFEYV